MMKRLRTAAVFALLAGLCMDADAGKPRMVLGANVNESGTALEPLMLQASRTSYVRTFFPASEFIRGQRNLQTDENLLAVKAVAASGQRVILCLKWDFKKANWRVPKPGSELEQKCFAWADGLIRQLFGRVAALETVNEFSIDTLPEDLQPGTDGSIPMVRFLQRLVEHLYVKQYKAFDGKPLPLFSGGFTRLDREMVQQDPAVAALLDWIDSDGRVAGANFHIHMMAFAGFEQYLKFMRSKIAEKPYLVTEFSMVWKYKANLNKPIGKKDTAREYINRALESPVPESEWNAFLESLEWYDAGFLKKACLLMEEYGVTVATFALQQGSSGGRALRPDSVPWILNPIFASKTARSGNADGVARSLFFKDYTAWQNGH